MTQNFKRLFPSHSSHRATPVTVTQLSQFTQNTKKDRPWSWTRDVETNIFSLFFFSALFQRKRCLTNVESKRSHRHHLWKNSSVIVNQFVPPVKSQDLARWFRETKNHDWATRSSVCSLACINHSLACPALLASLKRSAVLFRLHTHSLTTELVGQTILSKNWMRQLQKVSNLSAFKSVVGESFLNGAMGEKERKKGMEEGR